MTYSKKSLKARKGVILTLLLITTLTISFIGCNEDDENITYLLSKTTIEDGDIVKSVSTDGAVVEIVEDAEVMLQGQVKFSEGTTLKINPGVTVKGDPNYFSYLIIDRGAKIEAIGTAQKPITFTSGKAVGERGQEDWGGIVINGYAQINAGETAYGEGDSGLYGGNDDTDNSGTLKYVRIMFAGKAFSATDELNGLCLQGVGSGTTIDYVQMHNCKDDGIEMFGGNVNLKHIISTGNGDDQIDCTFGWRGKIQFAISVPLPGCDTNFEHDSNEDNNDATPIGDVTYYNVTSIRGDGDDVRGARIRRGTHANFYNTYFAGAQDDRAITSEDDSTEVTVNDSLIEQNGTTGYKETSGTITTDNIVVDNAPAIPLIDLTNVATYAALEAAGPAAFAPNASPTNTVTAATPPDDGFYDTTATYIGAVQSSANNWASGWTDFPEN